jgi:serine protease Do
LTLAVLAGVASAPGQTDTPAPETAPPGAAAPALTSTTPPSARRTPVVEAVRRVMPSVVSITSEKRSASNARWPFSPEENQRPRVSGMGTGIILDERGYILTNQHVVDRVEGIEVLLADGTRYPARVLQQDPMMDIALLKVDAGRALPAIRVGSSADLLVGETVITIGNAFGYENTVSVGIVSALNRNVTLSDDQVYRNLIQTDACINPGNSGGPLVNIDGELIGINVAVRAGAQGIGFALPIDDVKRVALEMLATRRLASTWHGIVPQESFVGTQRVVLAASVQPGSPAEAAGVEAGDQVVKVGRLPVGGLLDIERGLLDLRPGDQTELQVRRNGEPRSISFAMQSLAAASAPAARGPDDTIWRTLGARLVPVERDRVVVVSPRFRGGLYVSEVLPGGPADRAAIRQGDILVGMNVGQQNWETVRPDNVVYILSRPELSRNPSLQYYLVRRNGFMQGQLTLGQTQTAVRR